MLFLEYLSESKCSVKSPGTFVSSNMRIKFQVARTCQLVVSSHPRRKEILFRYVMLIQDADV